MSAAKKQPYTINPAATAAANAVLLASAGLIDEDAIPSAAPWPVDATAPLATSPAWAGLAGNSAPVAMGDEALRAMGVTYDTAQSGPGPFAPLGVSPRASVASMSGALGSSPAKKAASPWLRPRSDASTTTPLRVGP